MDEREILITNKENITPKHVGTHEPYEFDRYEVTPRRKDGKCVVALYELPPQKANYPYHYHQTREEVFYVISGSGTLETPDGDKPIAPGDVIVCPPGEKGAHRIVNTSQTETLVYIDFDTVHSTDVVHYPRSDKIGIIVQGESSTFYKKDSKVGYYEGE